MIVHRLSIGKGPIDAKPRSRLKQNITSATKALIRMDLELNGKAALVTGSTRGIGRGIALAFAQAGCDLLLTARDETALADVATAIRAKGRKAVVAALDLRTDDAAAKLADMASREFGGLDILVNNAGTT